MTPEQREQVIQLLKKGEDLSPEWARVLFPPEKREYELVYHGKEREEKEKARSAKQATQWIIKQNKRSKR